MSSPAPEPAAETLTGGAAEVPEAERKPFSETLATVDGGGPTDVVKEDAVYDALISVDGGEEKALRVGGDWLVRYSLPGVEENAVFSATDMVWSKVKSHPWWPGQIFYPKYASEMALKCQKKDHFLVAYFGDKTFAWCESSRLKPFRSSFSHMEKQSRMDSFANAVKTAIVEVTRRLELGMSCHCMTDETHADLKYRKVENAGIKEGTCCVVVKGSIMNLFEPERLLEYVKALAQSPYGDVDRLELAMAKAQLKAFYRSQGRAGLSVFGLDGELLENDVEALDALSGKKPRGRPKKLKDVSEDANVLNDDLTVVSGKKSSRGRTNKLKDVSKYADVVNDDLTVVSGKKNYRVRTKKLKDVSKDADVANDDLTEVSGKKSSRGRPKKLKDVSEDADVVEYESSVVSGKNSRSRPKKLKDVYKDADVAENDLDVVSGKNSRGRPKKQKNVLKDADIVEDDLDVVSGKKKSRGRPRKLKDVLEDADVVEDDSVVVSGKAKSRGRPRKFKDVTKDADVVEDDLAVVLWKKSSRGRPRKLKDVLEDADVVEDDSVVVSGKAKSRGRPRKFKDVTKEADVVVDDLAVVLWKKSSRGRPRKLKDVLEDADVVEADLAVVSGKTKSRGRPRKFKDVTKDADVVEDDSAVVSGKKSSRGRPRKFKDVTKDADVVDDDSAVVSGKKSSRGRPRKLKDVCTDADVVKDVVAVVSGKKTTRGRIKRLKDVSEETDIVKDDSDVVLWKKIFRGRPKKLNDVPMDAEFVNDELVGLSGKKRSRGRPGKVQGVSEDGGNQKRDIENGKRDFSQGEYNSSEPKVYDSNNGKGRSRKKRVDYLEMVSPSSARNRSAKVGGRICKVASQVQWSPPFFKCNSGVLQTTDEMLSQLHLVAADPMKYHSLLSMISFFTDFRATVSTDTSEERSVGGKRGPKKKVVVSEHASSDVPMTDSYWNDLLLQSSPERESVSRDRKRKKGSKGKQQKKKAKSATIVGNEQDLPVNTSSPSPDQQEPNSEVVDKIEETGEGPQSDSLETPTALILSFTETVALPSEADLIKIFSRYGPLEEAETKILRETNRAKVVFKNRSNAEVAFSNAGNCSVFGQALVSFRLRYLQPSPKTSPCNSA